MISYLKYYAQLLKFRLSVTVVISALAGYLIGVTEFELTELALLIFGGFLVTGSANGFNQVLEKVNYCFEQYVFLREVGELTKKELFISVNVMSEKNNLSEDIKTQLINFIKDYLN